MHTQIRKQGMQVASNTYKTHEGEVGETQVLQATFCIISVPLCAPWLAIVWFS